jgi:hypothetical protein
VLQKRKKRKTRRSKRMHKIQSNPNVTKEGLCTNMSLPMETVSSTQAADFVLKSF